MNRYVILAVICVLLLFISNKAYSQSGNFTAPEVLEIDYSNLKHWAAHPDKRDNADKIPGSLR